MKPIFGRTSDSGTSSAPEKAGPHADEQIQGGRGEFHACCCPAKPIVRVTIPPSPTRPHSVDLLLCGHHYRVSRAKLAASGAVAEELPGHAADVAAALFQEVSAAGAEMAPGPVG